MADFINTIPQVPRLNPNAHLILSETGEVCSWVGNEVFGLEGIEPSTIRELLALIDGVRSLKAIYAELADSYDRNYLHEIILALSKLHILEEVVTETAPPNYDSELPIVPEQVRQTDFSRYLENLSLNLSSTRRETLNFPPSLIGKGARGLGLSWDFTHDVKSQINFCTHHHT